MNRKLYFNSFIEIYENLNNAIHKAGGSGVTLESLNKMTAAELLEMLATNNIEFVYTRGC